MLQAHRIRCGLALFSPKCSPFPLPSSLATQGGRGPSTNPTTAMPQHPREGRGRARPISKTQPRLGGSGVGPAEPAQVTGLTLGQALVVPESCTGKRLKVLWLPASLFLGRGRINPLFPLVFSPLSPQPPAPDIKLIGEKPQNFLLLPSGPQLLSSERNPPNPCFGPGPGLRDGHLAAPAPRRAWGRARSQPLAPTAPSLGTGTGCCSQRHPGSRSAVA